MVAVAGFLGVNVVVALKFGAVHTNEVVVFGVVIGDVVVSLIVSSFSLMSVIFASFLRKPAKADWDKFPFVMFCKFLTNVCFR